MVHLSADQSSRRTFERGHPTGTPSPQRATALGGRHNFVTRRSLVGPSMAGTLRPVLANGAHSTSSPSRVGVAKIAIAVAVIAAVVVGGNLLFGQNDGPLTASGGTHVDPKTPLFDFKVAKTVVVPVSVNQNRKKLEEPATAASDKAVAVMDTVYTESFLDPNSWNDANYDDAWTQFTQDAATQAQADSDTLTAGTGAGDSYDTITPVRGAVKPRVLMDETGQPVSVVASVVFSAQGAHGDGTYTLFKSSGQFFLRKIGDVWKVVAFQVHRADSEETAPTPSASSSGSAEATVSSS
jgi:hypothetical protein